MKKKVSILLGILLCLFHIMADTEAATAQTKSQAIKTNKDKVITIAIQGKIAPAQPSSLYITTWEGKLKMAIGVGGINYNLKIGDKVFGWASTDKATVGVAAEETGGDRYTVSVGDSTYGWASTDHVEPDVTFQGRDNPSPGRCAVAILVCIGNEAEVISGEAKGTKGVYLGRHAGSDDLSGNSKKYGLKRLRLGDVVAIRDHYDYYGTGRYEGAVTIGICIHGWSQLAGHGPGLNPVLTAMPGRIKVKIDPNANTAYYLGIKEKPSQ